MISIVVPVYNVEKWLKDCLDSILMQDFQDFELILVDDGSLDKCGTICDAYAERDCRVQVLHRTNGGLAAARNAGTEVARGDYITYVDSDDQLYPDYLSTLFSLMEQNGADISVVPFLYFYDALPVRQASHKAPEQLTGELASERLFRNHEVMMITAWGKLYRRETIGDPFYPPGKLHEDEFETYRLLAKAHKVVVGTSPCYGYRQRKNGIMSSPWNPKRLDGLEALEAAPAFLTDLGFVTAASCARKRYLLSVEISVFQCGRRTAENRAFQKKLIQIHRDYLIHYKREIMSVCTLLEKVTISVFCVSPMLYICCSFVVVHLCNLLRKKI